MRINHVKIPRKQGRQAMEGRPSRLPSNLKMPGVLLYFAWLTFSAVMVWAILCTQIRHDTR